MTTATIPTQGPKCPQGRPFPWHCPRCGQKRVELQTVRYEGTRLVDSKLRKVLVPDLRLPVCGNCGEQVFNYTAEEQIIAALERELADPPPAAPAATLLGLAPPVPEELQAAWRAEAAGASAAGASAAVQEEAKEGAEMVPAQFLILVTCRDERQQVELLEKFRRDGLDCRALLS